MRTSDKGIAALAGFEGLSVAPYRDTSGVWTFGVGHTASAGEPDPGKMLRGPVDPQEVDSKIRDALRQFRKDLRRFEGRVNRAFTRPLTQAQFDAAVSFDFNTGGIHRASWVQRFNAGDIAGAKKAFMNWRKPASIIPRRRAERDLFFSGVYPGSNTRIYNANADGRPFAIGSVSQTDLLDAMASPMVKPAPKRQEAWPSEARRSGAVVSAAIAAAAAAAAAATGVVTDAVCGWPWLADIINMHCGG